MEVLGNSGVVGGVADASEVRALTEGCEEPHCWLTALRDFYVFCANTFTYVNELMFGLNISLH